jgi:hypothetical protein
MDSATKLFKTATERNDLTHFPCCKELAEELSNYECYNGSLELLIVLAPAADSLGAMSRVDVPGVVGRLVVWVRVTDVGDDREGFRRARGPLGFRGYWVLGDDGWRGATERMLYRTPRWEGLSP